MHTSLNKHITFHTADCAFVLRDKTAIRSWLTAICRAEKKKIESLSYVFCSDEYLYDMNVQFLKHKTLTDIITFDFSGGDKKLNGEIYISIDRVKENAATLGLRFSDELRRVIIHGFLHMMGYSDKSSSKKVKMTKKEDACLSLWNVPRGTRNTRAKNRP